MIESPWVSSAVASQRLAVSEKTLAFWREIGYLKPGTHWRHISRNKTSHLEPDFYYHLRWCIEEMEYWKSHDAQIEKSAA